MGYPSTYEATISNSIIVFSNEIPSDFEKEKFYRATILRQNYFTFPNMHIFQPNNSVGQGFLDNTQFDIKILGEDEVPVESDYYLDDLVAPPYFGPLIKKYIENISKLKNDLSKTKLVKVRYELKTEISLCQRENTKLTTIKLPQPLEPWLVYFRIKKTNKIERELYPLGKLKVNPCTTVPMIDPRGEEAFWGMWYFWNPFQTNSNNEDKFNCNEFYKEGTHWQYAQVALKTKSYEKKTPELYRLKEKPNLKMSFFFNSHKAKLFNPLEGERERKVKDTYKKVISGIDFSEAKSLMTNQFADEDDSLFVIGIFLFNLSKNSILKKYDIKIEKYFVEINLRGILKLSAKPFNLKLVLSTNKPEQGVYEKYNQSIANSILEDDVIVVTAHSVFGTSLDLALKTAREKAPKVQRPKYQVMALLTCLSKTYFPISLLPPPAKGQVIDYIYALTTLTETFGIGALTMLGMTDHSMRFGQTPPFESWLKNAKYNNFLSYDQLVGRDP